MKVATRARQVQIAWAVAAFFPKVWEISIPIMQLASIKHVAVCFQDSCFDAMEH